MSNDMIKPFSDTAIGDRFWIWDPRRDSAIQVQRIAPRPNTRDGQPWPGWALEDHIQAGAALNAERVDGPDTVLLPDEMVGLVESAAYAAHAATWWGG